MKTVQAQFIKSKGWLNLPDPKIWNTAKTLILGFSSPDFATDEHIFKKISDTYPNSVFVGCSTAGEIQGASVFDSSVSLTFVKLEVASFRVVISPISNATESFSVGQNLAAQLTTPQLKGIAIFSDGLIINGSSLVEGFKSVIDTAKIPLGGGLAGDGGRFQSTFVVYNGQVKKGHVIAVGFYGDELDVSVSARGGWDIFGPLRTVTKSIGNELFEIDGRPALELYKEYLGERSKDLPASGLLFPLEIGPESDPSKKLVRTILSVDEKNNSLTFAGDIPVGWTAQLMRANFERVIEGSEVALEGCRAKMRNQNLSAFVLAVSCVGRRLVLGERTVEEIEVLHENLPAQSALTGFYSYGEIAPTVNGNSCELHNQTMTVFMITESL